VKTKSINIISVALTIGAGLLLDFGLPNIPVSLTNEHIDSYHQLSGCIFHPHHILLINNHHLAFLTFISALFSSLIINPDRSTSLKCISTIGVASITGFDSIIFLNIVLFNLTLRTYSSSNIKNITQRTILLSSILLGATLYIGETTAIWIAFAVYFSRKNLTNQHIAILFIPVIIYLFLFTEAPVTPQLPKGAQIVADDGVAGLLRPLFGPNGPDYQLCNRTLFKNNYFYINLIVLIIFTLSFILSRQIPLSIFVLAIAVSADIILPEALSHIMPIATLERVIPGYFFIPLQFHLFSLLVIRTSCLISDEFGTFLLSTCILLLSALSPTSRILLQNKRFNISQFPTGSQYPVIAEFDYVKPLRENKKYITLKNPLQIECSNPVNCKYVIDRDRSRRWYTRGQFGTEYIKLKLPKPQKIAGVRLFQDDFFSDFPRRLKVTDCASDITIVPPHDWLGSLYTTSNGEVYFSSQANIVNIILFKAPLITNCIEIRQIGYDPIHDWSMTEAELFKQQFICSICKKLLL